MKPRINKKRVVKTEKVTYNKPSKKVIPKEVVKDKFEVEKPKKSSKKD